MVARATPGLRRCATCTNFTPTNDQQYCTACSELISRMVKTPANILVIQLAAAGKLTDVCIIADSMAKNIKQDTKS